MAGKNEGEGSRTAARRYNEAVRETVSKRKDKGPGGDERPLSDDERREAEEAERAGRRRAKEFDPEVDRDYERPTK